MKEREEREARAEISEKIRHDHKDYKKKKKEHTSLKRKNSASDLKKEDTSTDKPNIKNFKNNLGNINSAKSPSDRFFAKIGNDILSPVTK